MTRVGCACVTGCERAVAVCRSVLAAGYSATHIAIVRTRMRSVTERAVRMAVMPVIAAIPVVVPRAAMPRMPPVRIIAPIPWRCPTYPERIPEPVVDVRTVDIYGFDDIVLTIDILVADNLRSHLPSSLILLNIDRRNILEYILCQYGLDDNEVFVVGSRFDYAQVIHHSVTVQVKIGESRVGVIQECFELLHILDCAEQCSHRFQIERLAYVL